MTDKEMLKTVGALIYKRRKAMGYSQKSLGKIIIMDKSNLSRIENGEENITLLTLQKIAVALHISIAELTPTSTS